MKLKYLYLLRRRLLLQMLTTYVEIAKTLGITLEVPVDGTLSIPDYVEQLTVAFSTTIPVAIRANAGANDIESTNALLLVMYTFEANGIPVKLNVEPAEADIEILTNALIEACANALATTHATGILYSDLQFNVSAIPSTDGTNKYVSIDYVTWLSMDTYSSVDFANPVHSSSEMDFTIDVDVNASADTIIIHRTFIELSEKINVKIITKLEANMSRAYVYYIEENEFNGTTMYITSDYVTYSNNTVYIGGPPNGT